MRLHVHRSGEPFLEALEASSGGYYAAFARSATAPDVLRKAEAIALERGHRELNAVESLRGSAERGLRAFFDVAGRSDPQWRYAHSSRVLLAVPDYPDVALIFLLRALRAAQPRSTVHALVQDDWQADLVRFEVEGGTPPAFRPSRRRALARGARTLARSLLARRRRGRCDVLIFTLGDNLANGATDAYFGDLAATLARRCTVHTVYAAPGTRLRLPGSDAISPVEAYIRPLDVVRVLSGIREDDPTPGRTPDSTLAAYLRAREQASGEVAMMRVMARGFEGMFSALMPTTVVYPFENRSWEKNLLGAARAHGGVRCVGYQHSSITPRHLAFSGAVGLAGLDDLPDRIVTCGEVTADLIATEIPQARSLVRVGAALRARRLEVPAAVRGVLAPISSSRSEAWEILRRVHEASALTDHPIIVRTHPTIPVDDLYAQLAWPAHVRLSRGRSLADDFAQAGVVVYSSSTVALEGLLYGRLPVFLDIGDVPGGDPMRGDHPFVFRARSGRDLADTLARIDAMSAEDLSRLREQGRAYAERYLIEPTAERVERMAAEIAAC